ncbi:hypothetical protein PsorP6_009969 [Peronosclerospora sorghi]|uniref:Uncharacterized protein n=1 Tax=Peronosclerospora sorghi TaxID=230839 RepID=A0ACC0VW87_9STRA|nr:hypothetical protein PsorP6_009969 [Peronosclerospora sorghi]
MPNKWGHNADRRGTRDLPLEEGGILGLCEAWNVKAIYFHMSEAPVDIQLQYEVEFRVNYNQLSDKEMACHLVVLPKGTIQMEVVTDQILDGVVTKSLPRGGHVVEEEEKSEETVELTEQDKVENNSNLRCDVISFTFDSMANNDVDTREDEKHDSDQSRTKLFPQLGYEVQFRVAKHR